jgi:hypothetical protein
MRTGLVRASLHHDNPVPLDLVILTQRNVLITRALILSRRSRMVAVARGLLCGIAVRVQG